MAKDNSWSYKPQQQTKSGGFSFKRFLLKTAVAALAVGGATSPLLNRYNTVREVEITVDAVKAATPATAKADGSPASFSDTNGNIYVNNDSFLAGKTDTEVSFINGVVKPGGKYTVTVYGGKAPFNLIPWVDENTNVLKVKMNNAAAKPETAQPAPATAPTVATAPVTTAQQTVDSVAIAAAINAKAAAASQQAAAPAENTVVIPVIEKSPKPPGK